MEKSNSFLHEEKKDFVLVAKKPKKPLTKEKSRAIMTDGNKRQVNSRGCFRAEMEKSKPFNLIRIMPA